MEVEAEEGSRDGRLSCLGRCYLMNNIPKHYYL